MKRIGQSLLVRISIIMILYVIPCLLYIAPTQPVISQEAFIMPTPQHPTTITTTAGGVISAESGRHDQDSVDGDHPDSGLGEDNLVCTNTC